jgi:membrane-bound ClpP family serine protease
MQRKLLCIALTLHGITSALLGMAYALFRDILTQLGIAFTLLGIAFLLLGIAFLLLKIAYKLLGIILTLLGVIFTLIEVRTTMVSYPGAYAAIRLLLSSYAPRNSYKQVSPLGRHCYYVSYNSSLRN